jgi:hypothetical protein
MLGRRSTAFLVTLPVLSGAYLLYANLSGFWERPKINEASEHLSFYLGIFFAVFVAVVAVGLFGFPSAIIANRLFQTNGRRPYAPYGLFIALSIVVAAALVMTLEGEGTSWDFPIVLLYFTACASIVWKIAYEIPNQG